MSADEVKEKVRRAYVLMTHAAPGMLTVPKALSYVGFSDDETRNKAIQMKLRRLLYPTKYGMKQASTPSPPSNVTIGANASVSSIDTASRKSPRTPRGSGTSFRAVSSASWSKRPPSSKAAPSGTYRKQPTLPKAAPASTSKSPTSTMKRSQAQLDVIEGKKVTIAIKKTRRTPHQRQIHHASIVMQQAKKKEAHMRATTLVAQNRALPPHLRKRERAIVDAVNEEYKTSVNIATVQRYVRNGMQGAAPLTRGPGSRIAPATFEALKGAYSTFLKLSQANGQIQLSGKALTQIISGCVSKAGLEYDARHLHDRLKRETADQFTVGEAPQFRVEQRRVGRDNANGNKGGRPSTVFYDPRIAGSATVASKKGYSYLKQLEAHNKLCCDMLSANGFDGDKLRAKMPEVSKKGIATLTEPQSKQRQEARFAANTAGHFMHAPGGDTIHGDDLKRQFEEANMELY